MAKKPKAATFIKDPLWYKDAVIYQVHVKSYFDSNNDGIGDFPGLIAKLDYIADLGVNTIWVLPLATSRRRLRHLRVPRRTQRLRNHGRRPALYRRSP
jgi:maltose alpha-D-glucosyltransferase / alpha-amylase